jgi:hypothetical protein
MGETNYYTVGGCGREARLWFLGVDVSLSLKATGIYLSISLSPILILSPFKLNPSVLIKKGVGKKRRWSGAVMYRARAAV